MQPFFLVDCNNFFVSCERVFNAKLLYKPVVVLSSNDACIIARSNEAKKLGIPMGAPAWEYEAVFKRHNVIVYSANFTLYGDMSTRIMQTLTDLFPDIEIYSIDEAFLHAPACDSYTQYGHYVRDQLKQRTGIPISIGIGTTKTMAKIANYFAKKNPEFSGVFDITAYSNVDIILNKIPVEEIWGIGYRYAKKLQSKGIKTARDFKYLDETWVRKNMTVVGVKTLLELRDIPCLSLEQHSDPKQTITVSRLFGNKTTHLSQMKEALASYVMSAAQKLRAQNSLAQHITVFAITTRHHNPESSFSSQSIELALPTAYTPTIIAAAHTCLEKLFMPEILYKKVGVILSDLVPADGIQLSTYAPEPNCVQETKIMHAIDSINKKMGKNKVSFAAAGTVQSWKMKQLKKSACFTTSWHELLTIQL